jgi:multidrug resistance protein MdtO
MRLTGAMLGGVIGMGAQIFILPSLDSIAGFTVLFACVTTATAWVATSGPRLSYFGVQTAVAFYLLNLQEFKVETSLGPARDRVIGVFLGLSAMWLFFDQIWGAPAAVEMTKAFISSLRLLAQFARGPLPNEDGPVIDRTYALRETINTSFDKARSLADGVLFEFGPSRQRDLALRSMIIHWQPQLRMIFITRAALLKYRYGLPGFELPSEIRKAQKGFDESLAQTLEAIANRIEGKPLQLDNDNLEASLERLEKATKPHRLSKPEDPFSSQLQAFLPLSERIEDLVSSLNKELTAEGFVTR